jgi:HK97 family phage major capsid protein
MTVEEILAALQAIIDEAGQQPLTDAQAARYEDLEGKLTAARRSDDICKRNAAYNTNVTAAVHVGVAKQDDGLERAFNHYLRTGQQNQDIAELRAQGEGVSASGGYMVPPGFRQKIVERMVAYGGLAAEVESFKTDTGNSIEYPTLDDTASVGGITAESAAVASGTDLAFGTVPLGAYKYTSAGAGSNLPLRVSVELLQDSAFDVEALVSRAMGTRIARAQAAHWCTGTGVGQPKGIVASSLTADETLDVSNVIDYDDLLDTEARLDPAYEQNAVWVMNKGSWTAIRGILDGGATGRPLIFDQAASGIGGRPAKQLLGYPVIIDQQMPDLATATNKFAILGDLKEAYVIRRVSNIVVVVNPYSRAANGEVEFTAWERADANIQNRNAYVILRNV